MLEKKTLNPEDLQFNRNIFALFTSLGSYAEFFRLEKYKTEVGKDYKHLVFYLCQKKDLEKSEQEEEKNDDVEKSDDDNLNFDMLFSDDYPTDEIFAVDDFVDVDIAEKPEVQSQRENSSSGSNEVSCNTNLPKNVISDIVSDKYIKDYKDVVKVLSLKVKHEDQFFLTMRRNAPFSRVLILWKRQASLYHGRRYRLRCHRVRIFR